MEQMESTALVEQAKAITTIPTAEVFTRVVDARGLLKNAVEFFNDRAKPNLDNLKKALDDAKAALSKDVDPLEAEYKRLGGLMTAYDDEQERIKLQREREQAIEDARKRKAAEEEKAELARLAAELGDKKLAREIRSTPIDEPPPQVIVKATPKTEASFALTKKYEVVNLMALIKAVAGGKVPILALAFSPGFLHKQATALYSACPEIPGKPGRRELYPGVEVYVVKGARQ